MTEAATAAPNTATAPAVAAAATATATAAPAANTAPASTEGFTVPADLVEWGSTKGYQSADLQRIAADPQGYKLLTSYREAEKHLGTLQGADKLVLPKEGADAAAWDAVYTKLGKPATPDQYKIEIPQGGDSGFALEAGKWFHEAGMNQKQADILAKQWNGYAQAFAEKENARVATEAAEQVTAVTKEWGANAKLNGELATRGVNLMGKELGLSADRINEIKNGDKVTLSAGEFLKLSRLMGDLGKTTGDTFEGADTGGGGGGGAGMSPEQAQSRLNLLQNDRAFYLRLQNKDAAAIKEREDLIRIVAGGK